MHSEFTKRIFTSIILLIGIFSFLIYANEDFFLGFILIIGFICYFEWLLVNSDTLGDRNFYKNSSIHLFGFFYFLLVLPTSAFYLRFDINLNFFYLILIVCIFSDVGGYVVGKTIGGKKLTKISPNKTISGSIGSFIFSMLPLIFIYLFNIETMFLKLNLVNIFFSLFVSLVCQIGDLFFSYFKRLNNKKNTSNLLPGHGGLLDRIDGLIIVLPVVWLIKIFEIF
jgi:phosphatidate cytidylyltransferase